MAFAQLLALHPRIHSEVRCVLTSGDIALVLLDWTLHVTLADSQEYDERGIATQAMEQGRDGVDGGCGPPNRLG